MSTSNDKNIDLDSLAEKEAVGTDGLDLGTVKEIGGTFIITQKGLINKKKYHLPVSSIESFDGDVVRFAINETNLESYEQGEENKFDDYSSFKASDMSKAIETTIPLLSEDLQVTKKNIEDNIKIIKEPMKETKTAKIELMYEKITIEKKPINNEYNDLENFNIKNQKSSSNESESTTELESQNDSKFKIIIPIKREEPVITKRSFVTEELIVRKQSVTETKTITEEITNEEIKNDSQDNDESKNRIPL
ncbi:YsnF/AvaK domain-containing protein [Candidatus Nitrosocosmicus sp. T]